MVEVASPFSNLVEYTGRFVRQGKASISAQLFHTFISRLASTYPGAGCPYSLAVTRARPTN
jgi:hypothetical protein